MTTEANRLRQDCAEAATIIGLLAQEAGMTGNPQVQRAIAQLTAAAEGRERPYDSALPFTAVQRGCFW